MMFIMLSLLSWTIVAGYLFVGFTIMDRLDRLGSSPIICALTGLWWPITIPTFFATRLIDQGTHLLLSTAGEAA